MNLGKRVPAGLSLDSSTPHFPILLAGAGFRHGPYLAFDQSGNTILQIPYQKETSQ